MSDQDLLAIEFRSDDLNRTLTIREYLKALLVELWNEGESFSGKRPFGNSGWQYDLYLPLIKAGAVSGTIDEDGYIDELDRASAHKIISLLIGAL